MAVEADGRCCPRISDAGNFLEDHHGRQWTSHAVADLRSESAEIHLQPRPEEKS
jgi:hypothetical protein